MTSVSWLSYFALRMNRCPHSVRLLIALVAAVSVVGSAGCDGGRTSAESVAESQQAVSEQIAQRAEARWQHLGAGDFEGAYAFETPGYRGTVPFPQYRAQYGDAVRWLGAEVTGVEVASSGDRATVTLTLRYEGRAPGGGTYDGNRPLVERWLLSDGGWWYVRD